MNPEIDNMDPLILAAFFLKDFVDKLNLLL